MDLQKLFLLLLVVGLIVIARRKERGADPVFPAPKATVPAALETPAAPAAVSEGGLFTTVSPEPVEPVDRD